MATEIFIEPELEELEQVENAAEWQSICEALNLEGQKKLTEKSPESKAPPYMAIDPKTGRIIRAVCPLKKELKDYTASTIPLDVLKEATKCINNGWFKKMWVFYDDKTPDPFLVGQMHSEHDWSAEYLLIARWGAELLPFEELERKAIKILSEAAEAALCEMKAYVDNGIENLERFTSKCLNGADIKTLGLSINTINGW